jgi:hypothetical protein
LPRDAPLATAPAASPPPSGLGEGSALDAEAELLRTIIDWHERHPHQPSNDRLLEHSGR